MMNDNPSPRIWPFRFLRISAVLFTLGAILYTGFAINQRQNEVLKTSAPVTGIGGAFTLMDTNGQTVTDKTFLGAPFLVFFGFTHCPDVCPTTLFDMSEVMRASGEKGSRLRALYITIDPTRDTVEVLKNHLSSFDPRVVGLTGDEAAIQAVTRAYRAYAKKVPTSDGQYMMDHTTSVYLMDKKGAFLRLLDLKRPPEEVAKELMGLL
jgi:protein SCO1